MYLDLKSQAKILKGPFDLGFDVTNKCNYRCKHCYNASGENTTIDDELTDEEFIDAIKDISKLHLLNICYCGGEPLLRADLLCRASDILYENGTSSISMVSNGYFLTDELAKKLKDHHINRIQISLDGATKDSCYKLRQNKDAFEKAVKALEVLKNNEFENTNTAFCPTKFNIQEIDDVCEICNSLHVTEIRIQPLMLSGRAEIYAEELLPTKEQYIYLLKRIDELNDIYMPKGTRISWGDPLDHLFRYKDMLKEIYTYSTIRANGNIPVSPYLSLSVGNIRKHKFSEYWEAGLTQTWKLDIVKKLADNMLCIDDMNNQLDNQPKIWWEKDITLDLIDDELIDKEE